MQLFAGGIHLVGLNIGQSHQFHGQTRPGIIVCNQWLKPAVHRGGIDGFAALLHHPLTHDIAGIVAQRLIHMAVIRHLLQRGQRRASIVRFLLQRRLVKLCQRRIAALLTGQLTKSSLSRWLIARRQLPQGAAEGYRLVGQPFGGHLVPPRVQHPNQQHDTAQDKQQLFVLAAKSQKLLTAVFFINFAKDIQAHCIFSYQIGRPE